MIQAQTKHNTLRVAAAQLSSTGLKPANEDSIGIRIPPDDLLESKGVALAIADGVNAARAGRQASEAAVQGFLNDFYSTPENWSVKSSGERVLSALNRWLYGQGQQYNDTHQGFITTFTALVMRSRTAHIFHVGDTRLYRLRDGALELLTKDHAMRVNADTTYLTRALGMDWYVEIDYMTSTIELDDLYFASSDGVHGFLPQPLLQSVLLDRTRTLEERCRHILTLAVEYGSNDNVSCQIIEVTTLPAASAEDAQRGEDMLPLPPTLAPSQVLDGFAVEEQIHEGAGSRLYRVRHMVSNHVYLLRAPTIDSADCRARFSTAEWIGLHADSPCLAKALPLSLPRQCLYFVEEYLEGETLRRWQATHPQPSLPLVVSMANQLVTGLDALHRLGVLHQDLRPDNVFLDHSNALKIIDLGAAHIGSTAPPQAPGPQQRDYAAPEYALERPRDARADQFALALTLYELLTGRHPYGDSYARASSIQAFRRLRYYPAAACNAQVSPGLDAALKKALSITPGHRYDTLQAFLADLSLPAPALTSRARLPLLQRSPLRFWQALAGLLVLGNLLLAWFLLRH